MTITTKTRLEEYFKSHNADKVIIFVGPKQIRLTKKGFFQDVTSEGLWTELDPKCEIEENVPLTVFKESKPIFSVDGVVTKLIIY